MLAKYGLVIPKGKWVFSKLIFQNTYQFDPCISSYNRDTLIGALHYYGIYLLSWYIFRSYVVADGVFRSTCNA
jgi:hypothetical protein